jgi:hypothetical protein
MDKSLLNLNSHTPSEPKIRLILVSRARPHHAAASQIFFGQVPRSLEKFERKIPISNATTDTGIGSPAAPPPPLSIQTNGPRSAA